MPGADGWSFGRLPQLQGLLLSFLQGLQSLQWVGFFHGKGFIGGFL